MASKRDFSKLVMLTLTPTEAVTLAAYIEGYERVRQRLKQPRDPAMAEQAQRIKRQLATMLWPADPAGKAPYPL